MFDLSAYNSFKLQVSAKRGYIIHDISCINKAMLDDNYIILGGGSDILFTTEEFLGSVLINRLESIEILKYDNDYALVRVGGGVDLDYLITYLNQKNIYGIENLSLIPGTVGAAPIQNVGAYGVEIGDFIQSIECVDLKDNLKVHCLSKDECNFAYRHSIFKQEEFKSLFITHVIFKLPLKFKPNVHYAPLNEQIYNTPQELRQKVIALREAKLPNPKYIGNAGSFFKNPYISADIVDYLQKKYAPLNIPVYKQNDGSYKIAAAWLIDQANCRGLKHGKVGVWDKQALVIVNFGGAKPQDIVNMAKYVSSEVKNKFNIELIPEVRLYGKHGEEEWSKI